MNSFIPEAFVVVLKVCVLIGLCWFLIKAFLETKDELTGIGSTIFSLLILFLIFLAGTFFDIDASYKDIIRKTSGYIFGIVFIIAIFLPEAVSLRFLSSFRYSVLLYPFFVIFVSSEVISLAFFLKDLSLMRQNFTGTYISGIAGLGLATILFYLLRRHIKIPPAIISSTGLMFGFLTIKLLFGGTAGYAEFSLIPSVQRGLMKFMHDFIHQLFVFFMIPDHPLLKTTIWNFIGLAFGERFTMIVTLCILIIPPLIISIRILKRPEYIPEELKGARRRKYIHDVMTLNRKRVIPVLIFIMVVTVFWFFKAESGPALYIPKPAPVVEENGFIILKLTAPGHNLGDGNIHKFIFKNNHGTFRFFVFKRPDGRFSVCLDACEICPPEGYGQTKEHLICIYCNTPIPFNTVGEPGGCNPIPISYSLTEKEIKIEIREIMDKWKLVHSGISGERN